MLITINVFLNKTLYVLQLSVNYSLNNYLSEVLVYVLLIH